MTSMYLDTDDSSEEESTRLLSKIRSNIGDSSNALELDNQKFIETFKIPNNAFHELLNEIACKLRIKGFFSLNAMVCDHLMYIRFIDAKHHDSSLDSNTCNTSTLKAKLEEDYYSHGQIKKCFKFFELISVMGKLIIFKILRLRLY